MYFCLKLRTLPAAVRTGCRALCVRRSYSQYEQQVEPLVLSHQVNNVRVVVLNNPKKRNALSLSMLKQLKMAINEDLHGSDVRAILLRATGPVFSAGHDLHELNSSDSEHHEKIIDLCTEVMTSLQDLPVPVIAEVRGLATAAGCQLVASCDITIASENAKFATPGVKVGLFCSTPGVAVARSVPKKTAMLMLLTGEPISAQDALVHGLVSKIVPNDELESKAMAVAALVSEASGPVVALGKAAFYRQIGMTRDDAYKLTGKTMLANLRLRDAREGMTAFVEKRPPVWSHTDKVE